MDLSAFDDRFLLSFVLGSPVADAQLYAIRSLLRLHGQADEALSDEIKEIEAFAKQASGSANERAVDDWVGHLHQSVFHDAAHSMAAAGTLAPFIESISRCAAACYQQSANISHRGALSLRPVIIRAKNRYNIPSIDFRCQRHG